MNAKVPPALFIVIVGLVAAVAGVLLYRQATDPLYHRDPDLQKFTAPSSRMNPQNVPPQYRKQMEEQLKATKERAEAMKKASEKEARDKKKE